MIIETRKELKKVLRYEKKIYIPSFYDEVRMILVGDQNYIIWSFLKALRKLEYYSNRGYKFRKLFWERRKNSVGLKYGIFIQPNCVSEGLRIWHVGSIVVHANAKIGKNCQLHGMNCIGNKGNAATGVPIIGDNVNIGMGAVVIGDITLGNNVSIGANAVVTNSASNNSVLAGVPAKRIGEGSRDK